MSAILQAAVQSPVDTLTLSSSKLGVDKLTDHQAALQFEGLVMTQMFQAMRKTIQPSGLFGDDSGSRSTYEYLLDQAVLEHAMTSGKGWGLADRLENSWKAAKPEGPA
ncbi:rod-binding protein [uncultured Tolumonas sp.]|uniref:rod-binding protein n=1 Tax=uncultured Tolumonas sp. TaxID=263765 RepID=UPI00292DAB0B|nr:rod-binding protein [uncultured Tolumonas sp.]